MTVLLGIDTGGTYTDAVLVDRDSGNVLAGSKALTTRHDLSAGITEALEALLSHGAPVAPDEIALVALSTTLATNALAEGHSSAVTLLLIGYDESLMRAYAFDRQLSTPDIVYLRGGHNERGEEVAPLDMEQLRHEVLARSHTAEAFAVSGYFSVRNSTHELLAREAIVKLTGRPVTCGHELTGRLNAVRRATTAALNAHLILPLSELIRSVRTTVERAGISAPLMVVKGDGSLIRAELALQRPIETVLSGPAASVVGAQYLARRDSAWVIDVGGTTTDIAALRAGVPRISREGARVGGWRTMVEAIDVHTSGLGGDSHVRVDREGNLLIGPGRVIPICRLAAQYPDVKAALAAHSVAAGKRPPTDGPQFMVTARRPEYEIPAEEQMLLASLAAGPRALKSGGAASSQSSVEYLEQRGLARRSAFTPTDALHVLGHFERWDAEAAKLAATPLARRLGLTPLAFCERVVGEMADRIATEVVAKVLEDEAGMPTWDREPTASALMRFALNGRDESELACQLTLRRAIVALGAPVGAYMPAVASKLNTELVIPQWSEVANAVGAVAGSVTQRATVVIQPIDRGERYRVYLPDGYRDFDELEAAVAEAQATMLPLVSELARAAGANHIEAHLTRRDDYAPIAGSDDRIYLGTELRFVASGRPTMAEGASATPELRA